MAQAVYKYPLETVGKMQDVRMPQGARLLSIQMQGRVPCVWALVDTSLPLETRSLLIVGTGWNLPDYAVEYVGTYQEGSFVWHLFDVK